ncbi:hypothetical protein L2E82_19824 [Cichorium intybus]|uniref:Uncharacterized protein n=1 Tax=Cichorium intybus TaxID=13427 RepID=A0ACB9DSE6_CICIN|nr:hypothetical protein L2E82_19824 [Cichorium intybus]
METGRAVLSFYSRRIWYRVCKFMMRNGVNALLFIDEMVNAWRKRPKNNSFINLFIKLGDELAGKIEMVNLSATTGPGSSPGRRAVLPFAIDPLPNLSQ